MTTKLDDNFLEKEIEKLRPCVVDLFISDHICFDMWCENVLLLTDKKWDTK